MAEKIPNYLYLYKLCFQEAMRLLQPCVNQATSAAAIPVFHALRGHTVFTVQKTAQRANLVPTALLSQVHA